jgi:hypothetical protein
VTSILIPSTSGSIEAFDTVGHFSVLLQSSKAFATFSEAQGLYEIEIWFSARSETLYHATGSAGRVEASLAPVMPPEVKNYPHFLYVYTSTRYKSSKHGLDGKCGF